MRVTFWYPQERCHPIQHRSGHSRFHLATESEPNGFLSTNSELAFLFLPSGSELLEEALTNLRPPSVLIPGKIHFSAESSLGIFDCILEVVRPDDPEFVFASSNCSLAHRA